MRDKTIIFFKSRADRSRNMKNHQLQTKFPGINIHGPIIDQ